MASCSSSNMCGRFWSTHCFKCHSDQFEQKAGLVLDSRQGWLTGGENGPAIVPGEPDRSLVVQALQYAGEIDMPPAGKLPDQTNSGH